MTIFCIPKQPWRLNFIDELKDDDVAGVRQGAVLDEKAAEADREGHAVKKEERHSGGRRLTLHLRVVDLVPEGDRDAGLLEPELLTSLFGKAYPVNPGLTNASAHRAAMEAAGEIGQHRRLAVSS